MPTFRKSDVTRAAKITEFVVHASSRNGGNLAASSGSQELNPTHSGKRIDFLDGSPGSREPDAVS
jgi:hypothetical protein